MHDDTKPRPSPRAVERLAGSVGEEVRDLRGALQRALDEADRHEADGRQDLAVAVLEEQRELLALVHQRLQTELAGAAVEREAESVLATAELEQPTVERPAGHPLVLVDAGPGDDEQVVELAPLEHVDGGRAMVGRLLASAAAAVLGITLLLTPNGTDGLLSIAGAPADDRPPGPTDDGSGADPAAAAAAAEREAPTAALPTADTVRPGGSDALRTTPAERAATDAPTRDGGLAATAPDRWNDEVTTPTVTIQDLWFTAPDGPTIPAIAPDPGDSDDDAADKDEETTEPDDEPAGPDDEPAANEDEQGEDAERKRADAENDESAAGPDGRGTQPPPSGRTEGDDGPPPVVTGAVDTPSGDAPSGDAPSGDAPSGPEPSTPSAIGEGQAAVAE